MLLSCDSQCVYFWILPSCRYLPYECRGKYLENQYGTRSLACSYQKRWKDCSVYLRAFSEVQVVAAEAQRLSRGRI